MVRRFKEDFQDCPGPKDYPLGNWVHHIFKVQVSQKHWQISFFEPWKTLLSFSGFSGLILYLSNCYSYSWLSRFAPPSFFPALRKFFAPPPGKVRKEELRKKIESLRSRVAIANIDRLFRFAPPRVIFPSPKEAPPANSLRLHQEEGRRKELLLKEQIQSLRSSWVVRTLVYPLTRPPKILCPVARRICEKALNARLRSWYSDMKVPLFIDFFIEVELLLNFIE